MRSTAVNGLPAQAIGVDGVTTCATPPMMPSSDTYTRNKIIKVENAIYSFGGASFNDASKIATDHVYKFNVSTSTWEFQTNMVRPRYSHNVVRLSEKEIFITGI